MKYSNENPQERAQIAEFHGWKYLGAPEMKAVAWACWVAPGKDDWQQSEPPDYFNDVAAVREAITLLTEEDIESFSHYLLFGETPDAGYSTYSSAFKGATASAAELSIALVKTLNYRLEDLPEGLKETN